MSLNILVNQISRRGRIAAVYRRVVFMIPLIFMVFLGQMACFGALASESRTIEEKMQDVWGCIFEADLVRAEALLGTLNREHPDDLLIQTGLGYLSLEKGEYDRAEKEFSNVIRLEDVNGDITKRSESVRHVVSLAFRGLGYVYLQKSDMFDANLAFDKAFFAFADLPSYVQFAVMLRKHEGDFKGSEEVHRQIMEADPEGRTNNRIQLAILYVKEGKQEEAYKLISGLPQKAYYAFDWAAFYSVEGNIEKAKEFLQIYLDRYRSYPNRCQQILRDVKIDVDFGKFRKSPQFSEWLEKATAACGSRTTSPV